MVKTVNIRLISEKLSGTGKSSSFIQKPVVDILQDKSLDGTRFSHAIISTSSTSASAEHTQGRDIWSSLGL